MLNVLVRKHPKVAAVYPLDAQEALASGRFTPRQFDGVFLDSAVELDAQQRAQVDRIARLAVIDADGAKWRVRDVHHESTRDTADYASQLQDPS